MKARKVYLPVFSPTRFEKGSSIATGDDAIWSATEDTTYQYNTMTEPVPVKAGMIRCTHEGVTSITFDHEIMVEIME